MRILVLGIGKIGSALLKDLVRSNGVSEIVAGDIDIKRLKHFVQELGSEKVEVERIDVRDHEKLVELMRRGFDVVASTLLATYNLEAAKAAIEAEVSWVDVGCSPNVFKLDESAKAAGVTIVPSCGLDPGIDRICEGYGARKLDRVEKIHMWCGGFPQRNTAGYNNPIRYKITWAWYRAISSYLGKAKILRDGKIVEVDKLGGPGNPEIIRFPEPIGECEAFYTSAPFWLIEQLGLKDVREAWNKTVRWRGHCDIWRKLIDLNLTSFEPVKVRRRIKPGKDRYTFDITYLEDGYEISPFEFLSELGEKYLRYEKGEGDVVVERADIIGERNNKKTSYSYEMIDFYDEENDVTAMGRTTAYPCSIVSQMIARGDIKEKGVLHAGKIGWNKPVAELFFAELAKRNIRVKETATRILPP